MIDKIRSSNAATTTSRYRKCPLSGSFWPVDDIERLQKEIERPGAPRQHMLRRKHRKDCVFWAYVCEHAGRMQQGCIRSRRSSWDAILQGPVFWATHWLCILTWPYRRWCNFKSTKFKGEGVITDVLSMLVQLAPHSQLWSAIYIVVALRQPDETWTRQEKEWEKHRHVDWIGYMNR